MKTSYIYYTLLLIALLACDQNGKVSSLPEQEIDNSICNCVLLIGNSEDDADELRANMDCIISRSNNDKDSFTRLINFAFNNCDGFAKKISKLNLSTSSFDTIQFSEPTSDQCQINHQGKWRDVLGDDSSYSIFSEDHVEHYESGILTGKWLVLSRQKCSTTYVVSEQTKPNLFPPHLGDTVVATTIGVAHNYVKNTLKVNGFEVVTIGTRLLE